uniref:EOG090X0CQA n=1 Tax=Ceriodaphnia reticulata TaxID=302197 RepID=A0A4Y7M0G0_9CRUS|nr:EOG090X0CQA [Ceriodaphnia reticulata]SVE73173.1 EOG090X0CQA [Ceriodaphnia reticulata]
MAEIKTEIVEENVKTELNEEKTPDIKQEIKTEDVKTEPNEEKISAYGPNNEKTGGDVGEAKPTTELEDKIIRQVEYYFGDFNLPKDKFLSEQILLDDGWIPIATMLKFARLSQLTKSPQVIFSALKKSTSGLMEVSESTSKIRRSKDKPVPEETPELVAEVKSRTVYCKGFPKEGTTIDKVLEFFKAYPTVLNVKMRYYKTKEQTNHFKGSSLVTFSVRQEAEKFMSLESVKYNDYTLQRQWGAEWEKEKTEEYEARQSRKAKKVTDENGNGEKAENDDNNGTETHEKIVLPRGTILKLTSIPSGADRDEIKKSFINYPADIAHVEFTPDNTVYVRLRGENDGKLVLGKLDNNKVNVCDSSVDVSLLEGEEEETYLKKAEEIVNNRAMNMRGQQHRGGRGGGRGRGRGRGRGGRSGRGGYKGQKRSGSPNGSRGGRTAKQSRDD